MNEYIVVHPGGVHLDEILSVGLICRAHGVMPVHRREPTEEELASPDVWVVDVGKRHEPDQLNFDHHQFERDAAPECALSLVAKRFGLHELFSARPWYAAQVMIDSKGAFEFAKTLGMSQGIPAPLLSPLDIALHQLWGAGGEGAVDREVVQVATRLAEGLVDEAESFAQELEECRVLTSVRRIQGVPVIVHDGPASNAVSNFLRAEWQETSSEVIALSVSTDPRPPHGVALYRFDDDTRIDLSRLDGDERIAFAHNLGFIAKTKAPLDDAEIEDLIRRALT